MMRKDETPVAVQEQQPQKAQQLQLSLFTSEGLTGLHGSVFLPVLSDYVSFV